MSDEDGNYWDLGRNHDNLIARSTRIKQSGQEEQNDRDHTF